MGIISSAFGIALNLLMGSWTFLSGTLTSVDWVRIGRRIKVVGYLYLGTLCLMVYLAGQGLYNGWFATTQAGVWQSVTLLITSGILWVIMFAGFKIFEMALGLGILMARLAIAIASDAIAVTENTIGSIWAVLTSPFTFSAHVIENVFAGSLAKHGVSLETIKYLLTRGKEGSSRGKASAEETKKILDEMKTASLITSRRVTVFFKNILIGIVLASVFMLGKNGVVASNGFFGFLNSPQLAIGLLILISLAIGKLIADENRGRAIGKKTYSQLQDRGFKWLAWSCIILLLGGTVLDHWHVGRYFDGIFRQGSTNIANSGTGRDIEAARANQEGVMAQLELMNAQGTPNKLSFGGTPICGIIQKAVTFEVDPTGTTVKVDGSGVPVQGNRSFKDQAFFLEGANFVNRQLYLIVTLPDRNGTRVPTYFAVKYQSANSFVGSIEEAQAILNETSLKQTSLRAGFNSGESQQFTIPTNRVWTNLRINIPDSCLVQIRMTGSFVNGKYGNTIGPDGVGGCGFDSGQGPIANVNPCGTFIQIGNNQPIFIGSNKEIRVLRGGQVQIGVNDDDVTDNKGDLIANVTVVSI